jgi:hypothetical protein
MTRGESAPKAWDAATEWEAVSDRAAALAKTVDEAYAAKGDGNIGEGIVEARFVTASNSMLHDQVTCGNWKPEYRFFEKI